MMSHKAAAALLLTSPVVIHAVPVSAHKQSAQREYTIPPPAPPAHGKDGTLVQDAAPEHYDLYAAMEEGVDQSLVTDNALAAMRRELAADANISLLETQSPGLIADLAESVRPMFKDHTVRVRDMYLPRMTALFARHLTPSEAQEAANFYRSEVGRRMLKLLSSNFTVDAVVSDFDEDAGISREDVNRDLNSTVASAVGEMTPEDLAEIERVVAASPGLLKLNGMQGEIRSLRTKMENEPLLPETEQQMQSAMEAVFAQRFAQ